MATTWLTDALNRLPDTFAVHQRNVVSADYLNKPISVLLRELEGMSPARRCGIVHSINCTAFFKALSNKDIELGAARTAHLCRHPVMIADAMATITHREWRASPKYRAWAGPMIQSILENRFNKGTVEWPRSIKAVLAANDESVISRLAGLWSRLRVEWIDVVCWDQVARWVEERGNAPRERYPIFRYEQYTADVEAFRSLVEHIIGEPVDDAVLAESFATPAVNKHRASTVTDPEAVYHSWHPAERDFFNTIMMVTGLGNFFAAQGLYSFCPVWSEGKPQYTLPGRGAGIGQ